MDKLDFKKYAYSLSAERLRLTIFPTERCNFRCTYCWENHEQGTMSQTTVEAIKKLLSYRAPTLKALDIEWFGGEPLLAAHIIADLSAHIQRLLTAYPALRYSAGITTNGYLLNDAALSKFCGLGITNYRIGLDGAPEFHNATRKLATNEATFESIWSNLLRAKASCLDFSITLSINFFPDNYSQAILPLLKRIEETFGEDKRFFLYFKAIQRLGGKNDKQISCITSREENDIIHQLKQFVKTQQIIEFNPVDYVCFAAEPNAMIIRANGDINKCIVALNAPYNNVGNLNADGTVSIDSEKFLAWSKGFQQLDTLCIRCPNKFMK
ncbi:hypothetical protein AGMMS4956_10820 [Bacteroidia bacterium]|nr:hypothetical protein AGMMS4956_10820 [Bacteroidia bacterium]